jgi:hypothetical protein
MRFITNGALAIAERRFCLFLTIAFLSGCADFGHYVSAVDFNGGVSADPENSDSARVTVGGKIYFRDPQARKLTNYSKDK